MPNLKINRLQHVGIPVTNLKASKAFYERLGFKNAMDATFPQNGATGTVSMMQLDKIVIELYQMPEEDLQEVRERKNGKIDHIAFDVDLIEDTYAILKAEGFTILEDAPVFLDFWDRGCRYFNILGPDEERLEFCQIL